MDRDTVLFYLQKIKTLSDVVLKRFVQEGKIDRGDLEEIKNRANLLLKKVSKKE